MGSEDVTDPIHEQSRVVGAVAAIGVEHAKPGGLELAQRVMGDVLVTGQA
jgi:hypothetical protein